MQQFFQQLVSGLADGAVFGSLALALVLIYKATEVINFAQGEMAMFTTYIAWSLYTHHGFSYWPMFATTLVIAFIGGIGVQRVVIRPLERASVLTVVHISKQDVGTLGVTLATLVVLWGFFRFTKLGLGMRAGAVNPDAARLLGVRTSWLLAVGWGFAAVLGAVSGMMIAPTAFLTPNMMQAVLIYAFAAAILGGLESPVGAVVGGLALGVTLNLLGTYVNWVTPELRLPVALVVLLFVLLVRPAGLFGRTVVRRV